MTTEMPMRSQIRNSERIAELVCEIRRKNRNIRSLRRRAARSDPPQYLRASVRVKELVGRRKFLGSFRGDLSGMVLG